jgi:adenylate cyclase
MRGFRSFRSRMLVLVVGLVLLSQALAFVLVSYANTRNATRQIAADLEAGAGVFRRLIDERSAGLIANARLLSGDFAFKQAFASGDRETILSAMENHLGRMEADAMLLVDPDGKLLASTLQGPEAAPVAPVAPWASLIARASEDEFGEASGVVEIHDVLQQVTVVPLFTPEPSAWILFGFAIDDAFARSLGKISDVTVLRRDAGAVWHPVASTLAPGSRDDLVAAASQGLLIDGVVATVALAREDYVALSTPLDAQGNKDAVAVLARSLRAQLVPYRDLMRSLAVLLGGALAVAVLAAIAIARSVTRPVLKLSHGARRIADGDYAGRMLIPGRDEISTLAVSFNEMAAGLQDRERVRGLLGKVVSPAIAEELLRRPISLGGEEREVSVLFVDIRGFTARCEGVAPGAVLDLLNRYLTRVTEAIEAEGGVVDKYIGDAVMALFGAPLVHEDHAARAVRAALGIQAAVEALNFEFAAEGQLPIAIGVGINTASVVAGNMGSASRMNYTVIGDGVNIASRIEALCPVYGAAILVSETTRAASPGISFREVDRVRLKGRAEALLVHEPTRAIATQDELYTGAMALWLARDFTGAASAFTALASAFPGDGVVAFHARRCTAFAETPPPDWDGAHVQASK